MYGLFGIVLKRCTRDVLPEPAMPNTIRHTGLVFVSLASAIFSQNSRFLSILRLNLTILWLWCV